MQPVAISEIRNLAEYELEREYWRPQVIALKDRRRIQVGEHLTFLFENRDTVRYQIQEMLRIERIVKAAEVAREVATYNDLIPEVSELSASLLIEYETQEERDVHLCGLIGLEDHVWLGVGALPPARACFDRRQISAGRISAVQYVKFGLTPEQASQFPHGAGLIIDHPHYQAERTLSPSELTELSRDL